MWCCIFNFWNNKIEVLFWWEGLSNVWIVIILLIVFWCLFLYFQIYLFKRVIIVNSIKVFLFFYLISKMLAELTNTLEGHYFIGRIFGFVILNIKRMHFFQVSLPIYHLLSHVGTGSCTIVLKTSLRILALRLNWKRFLLKLNSLLLQSFIVCVRT